MNQEPHEPKEFDGDSREVIGALIEVHRHLGPGLMNTTYAMCIGKEFSLRGIDYADEVSVPVDYKGTRFRAGYSIDFVVRRRLAVMIKCVERLLPVHSAQLITYLKLARLETGLLVNFNVPSLRQGLRRHTVQFEPPY